MTSIAEDQHSSEEDIGKYIDDSIERLTHWAEEEFGSDELIAAREQFFLKFGKIFHDDTFFGARMSYFLNYYLFERPISTSTRSITPVRFYLDTNPERTTAAAIEAIHELSLCIHGVFLVDKIKSNGDAVFLNLLNREKVPMRMPKSYRLFGLKKNQILQGFVFRTKSGYHPAAGIAYHPEGVLPIIRKAIKKTNKEAESDDLALLPKLASAQLKATRMKHVDPKTIYKMDLL